MAEPTVAAQTRRPGMPSPIPCRSDEFTADIDENRVLVAALDRLRCMPGISTGLCSQLLHLMPRLVDVPLVFVADRLRTALRGRLDVIAEPTVHLATQRRLAMRPDLVL